MMRLSSMVSVLALTSVALTGCAADAESTGSEADPANVALIEPSAPVAPIDRTNDARQTAGIGAFLPARPSDADRARQRETWSTVELGLTVQRYGGDVPTIAPIR